MTVASRVTTLDGTPLRYDGEGMLNPSFVCSSVPRTTWAAATHDAG